MKRMTLRRMADACGGVLHIPAGREYLADAEVESITTDSRRAYEGSVFAAICGQRSDGHEYIPQTIAQGALGAISEKELGEDICYIKVRRTIDALGLIAGDYLQVLDIPVVGISGSVGKTSTKEFIASVLSVKYKTLKTEGNFNNELGVPLTIFRLRSADEMAVIEMGINHFGEMHTLGRIVRPETGVITNIGECHLEFLGDRDGVLRAKTEMFDHIQENGHIILNGNDDKLVKVQQVREITPIFYGLPEQPDQRCTGTQIDPEGRAGAAVTGCPLAVWADELVPEGLSGTKAVIHTPQGAFPVFVPLPGEHMVMNALAATAVGLTYGLTLQEIKRGIESAEAIGGRLHIIRTARFEIIDDCYNANPMSMKASLKVLATSTLPTVAVLGDMGELGDGEIAMHEEVGAFAARAGIGKLVAIGERSRAMAEQACRTHPDFAVVHYETVEEFIAEAATQLPEHSTVLVKASHAMHFEQIVKYLEQV